MTTWVPPELAQLGEVYYYRWSGETRQGELVEIQQGRTSDELWCVFRDLSKTGRCLTLYGCPMKDVIMRSEPKKESS